MDAATRKKLPASSFAGPGRSFPVNDKKHARLAIGGATRSYNAGNISESTEQRIKSSARRKLGKGSKSKAQSIAEGMLR